MEIAKLLSLRPYSRKIETASLGIATMLDSTPKDHFDLMSMELMENARRDFELRLEKDRKEFDLKLFEISQKIQEDSRKIASRSFLVQCLFYICHHRFSPGSN